MKLFRNVTYQLTLNQAAKETFADGLLQVLLLSPLEAQQFEPIKKKINKFLVEIILLFLNT